jgi:hypothetical protein
LVGRGKRSLQGIVVVEDLGIKGLAVGCGEIGNEGNIEVFME